MRRILIAIALTLTSLSVSGALAPAPTHAQTTNPLTVTVAPSTVTTGSTATVSGHGFAPNYYAYVYYQRPDGTSNAFNVRTDYTGSFAFTLGFSPAHGTGSEFVSAYDYGTGRWAPFFTVTVTSGSTTGTRSLSASPNPAMVNGATTVVGTGFSPNNYVYVTYRRPDGTYGSIYVHTDYNGTFSFRLGFLRSHGCGTETVQAYDYGTSTYSNPPYTINVTGC